MRMRVRWPVWVACAAAVALCGVAVRWHTLSLRLGRAPSPAASSKPECLRGDPDAIDPLANSPSTRQRPPAPAPELPAAFSVVENMYRVLGSNAPPSRAAAERVAHMGSVQLKDAVKGPDTALQTAAAFAIARQPSPALVDSLLQAASAAEDGKTRSALLEAIASARAEGCIHELVARLGLKKDGDIQQAAATALLRSSSPDVVNALIARAQASPGDEALCREIGTTLARVKNSGAVETLLAGITSPVPAVVAGCASALALQREPAALEAMLTRLHALQGPPQELLAAIIGRASAPGGLPVSNDDQNLPSFPEGAAVLQNGDASLAALEAESPAVPATPETAADLITRIQTTPSGRARRQFSSALASVNNRALATLFLDVLATSQERDIVFPVLRALANSADTPLLNQVVQRYQGSNSMTERQNLVDAIRHMQNAACVEGLLAIIDQQRVLSSVDPLVLAAVDTLGAIGSQEALSPLFTRLQSERDEASSLLLDAIGRVHNPGSLPFLTSVANGQMPSPRLNSRLAAIQALGNFNDDEVQRALSSLSQNDPNPEVRAAAARATARVTRP